MTRAGIATISHDSFGRWSLVRVVVPYPDSCDWCGSRPGRFAYMVGADDRPGRISPIRGAFCSVGCMRAFHGEVSGA